MKNPSSNKISLAVLPFRNISNDREMDFFSDGMTEEIIIALAKIEQLKVISKTSSFYFKDHKSTLQEIAQQLNVNIVLEGSVRFAGEVMRINAQLIEVADDAHIWSSTWDRKMENVFAIQDEISLLIADKLREHFGHMEIADQIAEVPTQDLNAYEHYLRGRQLYNKWNPENVQKAITHYEAALVLDENLIEGHLGLADGYSFLAVAGFAPREEAWKKANKHLEKAKSIDPEHAALNFMLANQTFFTEVDYAQAMQFIKRSIASKPSYSDAHQFIAFLYMLRQNMKKAHIHIQYAKSIDPLNHETRFYESYLYYRSKEYEKAKALVTELLEANPQNVPAIILMAYLLLKTHAFGDLDVLLHEVPPELIMPDERLGLKCLSLIMQGAKSEREALLQTLIANAQDNTSFQAHAYLFHCYSIEGKFDQAFEVLEKLFEHRSSILLLAFSDPLAEAIQTDPRYATYRERIFPLLEEKVVPKRTNTSALDEGAAVAFQKKLNAFIKEEHPYLNPSLTLRSLAAQIDMHPNQLSWLLNERMGRNFNEFINQFRVEHFKQLVVDPRNANISLIGLAYESGFNSKTVFNTTFKKMTGTTPGAYQKSQVQ